MHHFVRKVGNNYNNIGTFLEFSTQNHAELADCMRIIYTFSTYVQCIHDVRFGYASFR